MNIIKSLWPAPSADSTSIPVHVEGETEDSLDLKIKALNYFFKRFDIPHFPPFVPNNDGCSLESGAKKDLINGRLDTAYNKLAFELLILENEHRILVDWVKNRFRSLLILSSCPEGVQSGDDIGHFGRQGSGYKLAVLESNSTDEKYIQVLSQSAIYQEHNISDEQKTSIIKNIIEHQKGLKPSFKKTFNKDDRAVIILRYVERLSELVQIDRIYKASLLVKLDTDNRQPKLRSDSALNDIEEESPNKSHRPRSPARASDTVKVAPSPLKMGTISTLPPRTQSSTSLTSINSTNSTSRPPSALRSRSTSPVKSLKKKQSMTLLKMDSSLQQHRSNSIGSDEGSDVVTREDMAALKKQAETAVLSRLERERKLLK